MFTDVTTDSTPVVVEECMKAGKEYKQLIQLFVDQTIFGESLLEQATTISIDDSDVKLSEWLDNSNLPALL